MIVTRNGHDYDVCDEDLSGDWDFWARFADGRWEPEILDRYPDLLERGGTYLDIGSWIGPQLLVASNYADTCIGFEPDPTAFGVLCENVEGRANVWPLQWAIADFTGETTITTEGDSMSRIGHGSYEVECYTVEDACSRLDITDASLVKIDIEGAEQDVFPQASDLLRSFDCPVFLSIHPWITRDPFRDTSGWRVERLADHEVLLWPV